MGGFTELLPLSIYALNNKAINEKIYILPYNFLMSDFKVSSFDID